MSTIFSSRLSRMQVIFSKGTSDIKQKARLCFKQKRDSYTLMPLQDKRGKGTSGNKIKDERL